MTGDLRRYAAANARARTLLASLLGRSGLEALYSYPTPQTFLDALQRTPYSIGLSPQTTAEPSFVPRLAAVARALLGLVPDPERAVLHAYLLHHEVTNLKVLIRAIDRQLPWHDIQAHLVALPGIATIDLRALADSHDLRDLVDRLAATPYGPPLRAALHRLREVGPFALEVVIELDHYDRLWATTAALKAPDAARARHLLGVLFDILNLGWIARYRDVLALSAEEILNYTLRPGRWLTVEKRRALAEGARHEWSVALERTPYAPLLADAPTRGFDGALPALWRYLATQVQRALGDYPFHIAVPLGLLLAQDIEIRDLQVLLAAKRMELSAADALERAASVRH